MSRALATLAGAGALATLCLTLLGLARLGRPAGTETGVVETKGNLEDLTREFALDL